MGRLIAFGLVVSLPGLPLAQRPTTSADQPYMMSVAVDEVSVTFHAADFEGVPMNDLTIGDVRVTDSGKKPRRIVSFEVHERLPVRIGILADTSRSVLEDLDLNQTIATAYVQHLFQKPADRGFVMRFDSDAKVVQDWTDDRQALVTGIAGVAADSKSRLGGTALFDAIYRACRDQFGKTSRVDAGNFILLFSDGLDNASHARIEDDIAMCQSTNTAIYVFSNESDLFLSEGQKTLRELALKSGGLMFTDQKRGGWQRELQILDASLRSQYLLVYKPERLKRDGAFHRIRLDSPSRGGVITTRSGYYAPR